MVIEPLIVGLLLLAALMHASWNAMLKADQSDRFTTFGTIMITGSVMGLCAVPFLPWVETAALKYLVASVLIQLLYYFFLLKAYAYGDLSHTYPIARGTSAGLPSDDAETSGVAEQGPQGTNRSTGNAGAPGRPAPASFRPSAKAPPSARLAPTRLRERARLCTRRAPGGNHPYVHLFG